MKQQRRFYMALTLFAIGCSGGDHGQERDGMTMAGTTAAGTSGLTAGISGGGAGVAGDQANTSGTSGEDGGTDECPAVSQQAKVFGGKADVIWVLDTSASMFDEVATVQGGFASFVDSITKAGSDLHTILIGDAAVCMPAPVGTGTCPNDSNTTKGYLHEGVALSDFDSLSKVRETYGDWRSFLRPEAAKMIIVVSDGDAITPNEAMSKSANEVAKEMYDWVSMQSEFADGPSWKFSAIYCTKTNLTCTSMAEVFPALIDMTGGIHGALDQGAAFEPVIQEIAKLVIKESKPVDCEWGIPKPPAGQVFDSTKLNLEYTPSTGKPIAIYGVPSKDKCHATKGGWYYDNATAPTRVITCPSSCTTLQADEGARVDVKFGCATVFLEPE